MEKKNNKPMIAVCGIDCATCGIRLAPDNPEIAERLVKSFQENGLIPHAEPSIFHCDGCRGDRSKHWSENCWILKCCVDDKGLEYCSQCRDFPCNELAEWSAQNERYQKAFNRLKDMGILPRE